MKNKKRGAAASHLSSKHSPPPSSATAAAAAPSKSSSDSPVAALDSPTIRKECEKGLTLIRRGNHNKAFRLMKELCQRFDNSALVHRIHGSIIVNSANVFNNPATRQRHLSGAIGPAKKAVTLSPNSIEFACFHANVLYEVANDSKEYEEVMAECERALAIEKPNDPFMENPLLQQLEQNLFNAIPEARVAQIQNVLHVLIQKSNLACNSYWMKKLDDDKFRLVPVPVPKLSENQDEIKKVTMRVEEQRKETGDDRVAAASLLQLKSDHGQSGDGSKGSGSKIKINEQKRHGNLRRNASIPERKDQVIMT